MPRGRRVEIDVTSEHVQMALERTSTRCAIAMAIKAANPHFTHPDVTQDHIRFSDQQRGIRYTWFLNPEEDPTDRDIVNQIDQFDRTGTMSPMRIALNTADAIEKPIRHAQPSELIAMSERVRGLRVTRASNGVHRSERKLRG